MNKLRDNDIRRVLLSELYSRYSNDNSTRIVNEMGVLHGQSRVDVAVINGILHGFEIKSESDTLERLPSQMRDYNKVFDRITVVTQRKYLSDVRAMVPKWWGIWLVTVYKGDIHLRVIRKGKHNEHIDARSLSHLLWRDEAIEILKKKGLHKGYLSKPRKILYDRLSQCLDISELKIIVIEQLKNRKGWRDHELLRLSGD